MRLGHTTRLTPGKGPGVLSNSLFWNVFAFDFLIHDDG